MDVVASQSGILQAWFDWNGDGDWSDAQEHALSDQRLSAGTNRLTLQVPQSAQSNTSYARFRFARQSGLPPIGPAGAGEVEDYVVAIETQPVEVGQVVARDDSFRLRTGSGEFTLSVLNNDQGTGELNVTSVTQPARGSTRIAADGSTVLYTPSQGFTGKEIFTYRVQDSLGAVGQAEVTIDVEPSVTPTVNRVALRFEATDASGSAVSEAILGEPFVLNLFVQDIRSGGAGVARAYVDVAFDGNLSAAGPILAGPFFADGVSGAVINGQINEVGGRSSASAGAAERLLFSVPLVANDVGRLQFAVDDADVAGHDVRLVGDSDPVPSSRWIVSPLELRVTQNEQTPADPLDVDRDGFVTPLDALLVINDLNQFGARVLAGSPFQPLQDVDVDDDGTIAAIDALLIINRLNRRTMNDEINLASIAAATDGRERFWAAANNKQRGAQAREPLADDSLFGLTIDADELASRRSLDLHLKSD